MDYKQKILTIDLGIEAGWAFSDAIGIESGHWHAETYYPWGKMFLDVLDRFMPDVVVCSQTNSFGHFNASRKAHMLYGIVCYLAEQRDYAVVEFNDSSARKAVFGNGKLKKIEAHKELDRMCPEHAKATADEKDAIILALGWQKLNQE